jgi:hypothetical protein
MFRAPRKWLCDVGPKVIGIYTKIGYIIQALKKTKMMATSEYYNDIAEKNQDLTKRYNEVCKHVADGDTAYRRLFSKIAGDNASNVKTSYKVDELLKIITSLSGFYNGSAH